MTHTTGPRWQRYALLALRIVLAAIFVLAGSAKLLGVPMMVTVFEHVGLGQWFRYVTGAIEIGGGVLLLTPRLVGIGAALLFATMVCAVFAHLVAVPGPPFPAAVLAVLTGSVAWVYRAHALSLAGVEAGRGRHA